VNHAITSPTVRLIGDDGGQVGVVTLEEALKAAENVDLDLVEIVPNAEPPVCRVMDFGKFIFDQNKKRHVQKKRQKQVQVKEIKLRPGTGEGDYQIKLRNVVRFLEQGDKVKVTLRFRGREMAHQDLGAQMLKRVEQDLVGKATVEQMPKLEGRLMVMVMSPAKRQ
jgi:translation initiation factor IF-3